MSKGEVQTRETVTQKYTPMSLLTIIARHRQCLSIFPVVASSTICFASLTWLRLLKTLHLLSFCLGIRVYVEWLRNATPTGSKNRCRQQIACTTAVHTILCLCMDLHLEAVKSADDGKSRASKPSLKAIPTRKKLGWNDNMSNVRRRGRGQGMEQRKGNIGWRWGKGNIK